MVHGGSTGGVDCGKSREDLSVLCKSRVWYMDDLLVNLTVESRTKIVFFHSYVCHVYVARVLSIIIR